MLIDCNQSVCVLQSIVYKLKSCVCFFTELLLNIVVYMKEKLSWHWNENADNFGTIQRKNGYSCNFPTFETLEKSFAKFYIDFTSLFMRLISGDGVESFGRVFISQYACIDCIFGCACMYKWHAHTNMLVWNIWWLFLTLT